MTWIKEESVACKPCRIVRIAYKKRRVQHIGEVGSTHCSARMT